MPSFVSGGKFYYLSFNGIYEAVNFDGIVIRGDNYISRVAVIDSNNRLWYNLSEDYNTPLILLSPDIEFSNVFVGPRVLAAIDIGGNFWYTGELTQNIKSAQFTRVTAEVNFVHASVFYHGCMMIDVQGNMYVCDNETGPNIQLIKRDIKTVNANIISLCVDFNGDVWILTYENRLRENIRRREFYRITEGIMIQNAVFWYGDIFLLSENGQVLAISKNILETINTPEQTLNHYTVVAENIQQISGGLFLDINGEIWKPILVDGVLRIETPTGIENVKADLVGNQPILTTQTRFFKTKSSRNYR